MSSLIPNLVVRTTIVLFVATTSVRAVKTQPNFIVIQPDDHYFFEEWNPPGQFDGDNSLKQFPPKSNGLPNINRIREAGIEMKNAYAASTMCGTSRYSTITGRYPSRSSYGRALDEDFSTRNVMIPRTKLEDVRGVDDPKDCSGSNIAALLQRNGYQTGVVGKWHLTPDDGGRYNYDRIRNDIKYCGFDFAEAIYKENMWGDWFGDATHNMEHVTSEAIHFINDAVKDEDKPFFLYFNPTVPHDSGDVTDALQYADCRDTVGGRLSNPPDIPYGMTADFGGDCRSYRQTVLDRGGLDDDKMAGAVWVDDAIGSLFQVLESLGVVDNTFILFQLDHGEDAKGSLFEGGSRIVQFIHYPDLIPSGSSFHGLVSTIDVAATIVDLAGVPKEKSYNMDGKSWVSEVVNSKKELSSWKNRCLFVEQEMDRSIRCGCYKYISIRNMQNGFTVREARKAGISIGFDNYYYLCDDISGEYINAPEVSPERSSTSFSDDVESELLRRIECHLKRTNPSDDPNYDMECDGPLETTDDESSSTAQPTRFPTLRPSRFEIIADDDVEISDFSNETERDSDAYCSDDPEYLYYDEDGQDCQWVIENDRCDREDPETNLQVGRWHCPESCSYCQNAYGCFDNPYFRWYGQEGNDCEWLEENDRCDRVRDSVDGTIIHVGKQYCPESCGYCSVDFEISK